MERARQHAGARHLQHAVKLFYTGPVINAEMLVMMLEKHGIKSVQEMAEGESDDADDLNRQAQVFVSEADHERAHRLFYAEREDEL
jgi:hypothetical protein